MDMNGIMGYAATEQMSSVAAAKKTDTADAVKQKAQTAQDGSDAAVIYEKNSQTAGTKTKKAYTQNAELVKKMKEDAQQHADQLQALVGSLISGQGKTYANANVFTNDFWKQFAANGGTVSQAAVKQAQEDIAEDGYYGVKQTSERILDFAKALTGGDPDKITMMEQAFEKGYKQATKAWGTDLPSLCSDTYDAVKKGFQQWREEAGKTEETE